MRAAARIVSAAEAVAAIPDGASLAVGGFLALLIIAASIVR